MVVFGLVEMLCYAVFSFMVSSSLRVEPTLFPYFNDMLLVIGRAGWRLHVAWQCIPTCKCSICDWITRWQKVLSKGEVIAKATWTDSNIYGIHTESLHGFL